MVCRLPLLPSWIPFTILLAIYMSLVFGEIPGDKDFNNGEGAVGSSNVTKNYTLTGIPQLDYVHDPNLPRELNGYNLSTYPFLNKVPQTNYSCEGLKDGFYASVEFSCQLYHQCLFGNRYDFLCANYTAFDQRTFICHFVSEVDCPNSALFFHRNDALYIGPTSTTDRPRARPSRGRQRVSPLIRGEKITASVEPQAPKTSTALKNTEPEYDNVEPSKADEEVDDQQDYEDEGQPRRKDRKRNRNRYRGRRRNCRGRRWCRRKRPQVAYYDDYYEDDDYAEDYDDEYADDYDDAPRRSKNRGKIKTRGKPTKKEAIQSSSSINSSTSAPAPNSVLSNSETVSVPAVPNNNSTPVPLEEIFSQSRPPPKIRPPVPRHAVSKYEVMQGRSSGTDRQTGTSTTTSRPAPHPQKTENAEYVEYDYEPSSTVKTNRQLRNRLTKSTTTTTTTPRTTTTTTTSTTTTTTTTTPTPRTTEAPEYEYYDYEEDEPQQEQVKPASPIPTTTTTTTTPRPQYQNRRLRNRKPDVVTTSTQESVYSTGSSPIVVTHNTDVSVSAKTSNLPDRFLRRTKPVLKVYSMTNPNLAVTEPIAPSISSIATSEIPVSNIRQEQSNFNQRFPSYEVTNSKPSEPQTQRPSRFWQRQQKIVTSTTTTLAPQQPEYIEYYDDTAPMRYGGKSSSTSYTEQPQQQRRPQTQYSTIPDSTEIPQQQRMVNYNTSPRYQQSSPNVRPLDQSNFVTPYATQQPNMRPTPEFISLIPDEESYYSVDPRNSGRFHNTPVRQYSAAAESYPSYAPPPPTYGQYLKRIQQRHVVPQSYPWY